MKPFCGFLTFFILLLVAAIKKVNSAAETETVSFHFDSFQSTNPLLDLQGDAKITDGFVELTNIQESNSIGRLLYGPSVRISDEATGTVASFITTFYLEMKDVFPYTPADGIVFFIAPEDTQIPPDGTGGSLGVANSKGVGQFVGVEFDNYVNSEFKDPKYTHIGIDVNSVVSNKTVEWKRVSGSVVKVTVIYESSSTILSVAVINESGDFTAIAGEVDLKAAKLPGKVKIGFSSAASVLGRQKHHIHSWSFTSTLETGPASITNNRKYIKYVSDKI